MVILVGVRSGSLADEIALIAAETEFRANAQERRHRDALQDLPGVVIDVILQPGITGGVSSGEIIDLDR